MSGKAHRAPLSVSEGYDQWAPSYDTVPNATRDAAAARVLAWSDRFQGRKVLELGCGTGRNTSLIARNAASVTGLDFSQGMLARARRRPGCRGVRFQHHDLTAGLPFAAAQYEVVLESLVLEHFEDLGGIFREVQRVLDVGGHFLGSELHPHRQLIGKQARFQIPGSADEVLIEAHQHTVSEFVNSALSAGFEVAQLDEDNDPSGAPRLFSFCFLKSDQTFVRAG